MVAIRQNVYDREDFFAAYQQMRRARSGINEAVEQPAMRSLLADVSGLDVLDLGCGDGQLARDLIGGGAAAVLAVDPSQRMLGLARSTGSDERIEYRCCLAEDLTVDESTLDLTVSSLAFHYIADLAGLLENVARWLRPGGRLVASMEHPLVTAAPHLGPHPCVVADYALEGRRETLWFVDGVVKYHRRVSTVINSVIAAGLVVTDVLEPTPTPQSMVERPDLERHVQRPSMLVVAAAKPLEAESR